MNTAMNTALTTAHSAARKAIRVAAPLLCAALVTLTGVQVIAGYALPATGDADRALAAASMEATRTAAVPTVR